MASIRKKIGIIITVHLEHTVQKRMEVTNQGMHIILAQSISTNNITDFVGKT